MSIRGRYRFIQYGILSILLTLIISFVLFYTEDAIVDDENSVVVTNSAYAPDFRAFDSQGNPYHVVAKDAYLNEEDNMIILNCPAYTLTFKDGKSLHITATKGLLTEDKKKLHLEGSIKIKDDRGYTFETEAVDIKLEEGFAKGDVAFKGASSDMKVEGGAFEMYDKGDKIVLTKRPTLHFHVKKNSAK